MPSPPGWRADSLLHPDMPTTGLGPCVHFLGLLVSRITPTGWSKATETYPLIVLGARSPESRCWQGHTPSKGSSLFLSVPDGPWCSLACGCTTPSSGSVFTGSSQCLGLLLVYPLQGHLSLILGSIWVTHDDLILRSLMTPTKTHFPNKVTHTSTRDEEVDISLGAPSHYSTQHLQNEQMNVRWHEVQGMPTQHFQF